MLSARQLRWMPTGLSVPILDVPALDLPATSITLLVGATGAGKTTLLQTLSGAVKPTAGDVVYDGRQLWTGGRLDKDVLLRVGVSFQFPESQLFARTVDAELRATLRPYRLAPATTAERMRSAADAFAVPGEWRDTSPFAQSGGGRRRIALAATFAAPADWWFLDEPTAGLDAQSTARFCDCLRAWRAREQHSGGYVIATHDWNALFPLADRVLILADGRIAADTSPADLCRQPQLLQALGTGVPASVRMADALWRRGIRVPPDLYTPEEMASWLIRSTAAAAAPDDRQPAVARTDGDAQDATPPCAASQPDAPSRAARAPAGSRQERVDPRAKWAATVLLSIGMLAQSAWIGVAAAALICVTAILLTRPEERRSLRVLRLVILFAVAAAVLSGWRWHGGAAFSWPAGLATLRQALGIVCVMVLGVLLAASTSLPEMKDALERSLHWLQRASGDRLSVAPIALGAALLLYFVPLIANDVQRLTTAVRVRAKYRTTRGAVRLQHWPMLFVPLLLSILQTADDLATALDARGVRLRVCGASPPAKRWRRRDVGTVASAVVLLAGLLWLRQR